MLHITVLLMLCERRTVVSSYEPLAQLVALLTFSRASTLTAAEASLLG